VRLSTICVATLGVVFLAGLAPALFAQAELAQPGLQVVGPGGEHNYNVAITLHTVIFAGLMPLTGIALAFSVIAEARRSPVARAAAILALVAAPLLALALAAGVFEENPSPVPWLASVDVPNMLMLAQAAAGLVALVLIAVLVPRYRTPAIIFTALSGIALLQSGIMHVVLANSGIDHALHDTYYVLAANHAAGVAVALNILGALTTWSMRWEGQKRTAFSLVAGLAVWGPGLLAVLEAARIGLMGMPLRYVDYPDAFAPAQGAFAFWSMSFAAAMAAALIWFAVIVWRTKKPPGVETTFE
jgi:heme/copper-type cytochrome/quinol oxidase subunit 1